MVFEMYVADTVSPVLPAWMPQKVFSFSIGLFVGEVNEATVSELSGKVSSEREFGLFVSAGGFNKRARDFAFSKRHLKLIDGDELVQLVYQYYPQLDAKYKGMIPLRSVYIPETLTE